MLPLENINRREDTYKLNPFLISRIIIHSSFLIIVKSWQEYLAFKCAHINYVPKHDSLETSTEDNAKDNINRYKAWEVCSVNTISMSTALLPSLNDIEKDE